MRPAKNGTACGYGDAPLEQERAHLIDYCSALSDKPGAHAMHRLQFELIVGLERYVSHTGTRGGLRYCLGVIEVVLVGLDVGLHELCWNNAHFVTKS